MTLEQIIHNQKVLASLHLFRGINPESIEGYLRGCEARSLNEGDVLLSPKETNDCIYLIVSGRLGVHLNSPTDDAMTTLGSGACAGEMSVLENKKPSAYVVASEPCLLLAINQDTLWDLVNNSHGIARNLLVTLSQRVRSDNALIADNLITLDEYEHSATTDALTGLHNRHWLQEMFCRNMRRCKRNHRSACLIMLDVDHFKEFNDQHGHLAGDRALCAVADVLLAQLRPTDLIARFGGDEFAVLLPGATLGYALNVGNRIRSAVETAGTLATPDALSLTVSMGVAEMESSDTLELLLGNADTALYRAKRAGRNKVAD